MTLRRILKRVTVGTITICLWSVALFALDSVSASAKNHAAPAAITHSPTHNQMTLSRRP